MDTNIKLATLWEQWETYVLQYGVDDPQSIEVRDRIIDLEAALHPQVKAEANPSCSMERAHRLMDMVYKKSHHNTVQLSVNHASPGQRKFVTRFGAIYECNVLVRGLEKLLVREGKQTDHFNASQPALRLKDGFYHVNHFPGIQPSSSDLVNARNKNVEKVDIAVVERFVRACQLTGMEKRGWKKKVNMQFDISRTEFTKWLVRYFPCFGLPIPIERRPH